MAAVAAAALAAAEAASAEAGASVGVAEAVIAAAEAAVLVAAAISPTELPACRARLRRRRSVARAAVAPQWATCQHLVRGRAAASIIFPIRASPIAQTYRRIDPARGFHDPAPAALPIFRIDLTSVIAPAAGPPLAASIISSISTVPVLGRGRGQLPARASAVQSLAGSLLVVQRPNSLKTIPHRFPQPDLGLATSPTIAPQPVPRQALIGLAISRTIAPRPVPRQVLIGPPLGMHPVLAAATALVLQAAAVKVCVPAI